jgi:hypothetical protein
MYILWNFNLFMPLQISFLCKSCFVSSLLQGITSRQTLGNKSVNKQYQNPFLSLHLHFELDMIAYIQCQYRLESKPALAQSTNFAEANSMDSSRELGRDQYGLS